MVKKTLKTNIGLVPMSFPSSDNLVSKTPVLTCLLVVVVVYWRIHYIYCHSIDLTVIYNNSGYRWDAGSINI